MQLARDIDQRRLGLRQGRHPRRGITREEIGKRSSQENTDLCPHWKEAPGVSSTGWWQDRVEIREGTIFIEKKNRCENGRRSDRADHAIVGRRLFLLWVCTVYCLLGTRTVEFNLHREGGELPKAIEGTFITETEEREGVTGANEGA
jgi:hypothetical protein